MEDINKLNNELTDLSNKVNELDKLKETLLFKIGDLDSKLEKLKEKELKKKTLASEKYNQVEDGKHIYLVIHEIEYTDGNYPDIDERILGVYKTYKEAKTKIHKYVPITTKQEPGYNYKHFNIMESYSIDHTYHGELYAIYQIQIPY